MNKKNWLWIALAIIVVVGGVLLYKNKAKEQDEDVVKIGTILPLTGVSAELGAPMLEAMQIAVKTHNEILIKNGKKPIKLLVEDGKSTANGALGAFQKIRYSNPSAFIIFGDVPISNLAASVEKYDYPVIALAAAADNIPSLSEHYFRAWTNTGSTGKKLANYAKNELNCKTCAIFSPNINYGVEFTRNLSNAFIEAGGEVVIKETYEVSEQDAKLQMQKIISKSPDAVFVLGFGLSYISAFNQLKSMGYKGAILTDETITIPEYYKAVANAVEGTYFCSTSFDPFDKTASSYELFVVPFKEVIGQNPNAHSVFGYISVSILTDAILRSGDSAKEIEEGLKSMKNFNSIVGDLTYLPNRELEIPIVIRKMNADGTYTLVSDN